MSCNSTVLKEYPNWESPFISELGLYHIDSVDMLIHGENDLLSVEIIRERDTCNLLNGDISIYHQFFLFIDTEEYWLYSGDIGIYKIRISENCDKEVSKMKTEDKKNIPYVIYQKAYP